MSGTPPLLSVEEFWDWYQQPQNAGRFAELVNGVIVDLPLGSARHGMICALAAYRLTEYVVRRGHGYVCSNNTGWVAARDPATVLRPDLMLFAENVPFAQLKEKFADRPPELVIEVLSPSDNFNKVIVRLGQYLRSGVGWVWLLDPEVRSVSVHRRGEDPLALDETEELAGEFAPPEFRCRVADLFSPPGL